MEQKKIGIIGFGVIGRHLEGFLKEKYSSKLLISYFDDLLFEKKTQNSFPFKNFTHPDFADLEFYIGLGYKHAGLKKEIIQQLKKNKLIYPYFTHHTAVINLAAKIGNGTIIYPNCNIDFNVVIGEGAVIHNSCTVSHDSKIGDCVFLSPSVTLSGNVVIGDKTFVGAAVVFANEVTIGKNVQIGIGSVVTKSIDDNLSVIGFPAKPVTKLRIY